ncbi:MAG: PTS sugar transporter subunit IIB, partial [Fusobacteriaceae bacterium]
MKILLVCSGGMSSAMVVKSLINEGKKNGLEI